MSRRAWTGVVAGVVAALVLLAVGVGAYRAGQESDVVTRTVTDGGEVVRVVGHGWGYGPGPGFFLVPLLGILLVVLLVGALRRGWGGWGGGPGGPGWDRGHAAPDEAFDHWHRRAHDRDARDRDAPPA